MGSVATLSVGNLEIDWGKNFGASNHSRLFQPDDNKDATYHYADGVVRRHPALVRRLRDVRPRLELLGYNLEGARRCYERALEFYPTYLDEVGIDFDRFTAVMRSVSVRNVALAEDDGDFDVGEYVARQVFADPEFNKVMPLAATGTDVGSFFENLGPYIQLRLLMENQDNLDLDLIWRYHDCLDGGWFTEEDVFAPLGPVDRFLIVTEGGTDSFVIRRAIELLRPGVADFFRFIDMDAGYPFTGCGNLHKFTQGLASIEVLNKVLVVFDNDAEGRAKHEAALRLSLPPSMSVMRLPDLRELSSFRTKGPQGSSMSDINGRAASIECFLDMSVIPGGPWVRWTSYNHELDAYQGALEDKDRCFAAFRKLRTRDADYDFTRLENLVDAIVAECSQIAARHHLDEL